MNFTEFLIQESKLTNTYKTSIDLDKALELVNTKCSDTKFERPLIRGMRGSDDAYIFEGQNGSRRSITKTNYNTVILDTVIKELDDKYPLRSASVICTTLDDIDSTDRFGNDKYVIFPYNDTIIGYLTKSTDLNYTKFDINGVQQGTGAFRGILTSNKIGDSSFAEIVKDIKSALNDKNEDKRLLKLFGDVTDVEQTLKDMYAPKNLGYDFGTMKDVKNKVDGECWIGGKCVAIKYDIWEKLKK